MHCARAHRWSACALGALVVLWPAPASAAPARRFALLIAHNDGGPDTTPLRYAEDDARKVQAILRELGGFGEEDILLVAGKSAAEVNQAFDRLDLRIREARSGQQAETTLFVYYSGHGKAGELRLGSTRLAMSELRRRLRDSEGDMKLGVIDACESGAITREKGGRRGPSFLLDQDDRELSKGLILISSSSENEASQESDELGGSFFTHYWTSGLRGDADESGDQRITLGEAYAYTYNKTVSVTAGTRSGTQHPTFSYDLKGKGDVILTDLTQGRSGIAFPAAVEGDFLIFDMGRQQVAAEVKKLAGVERRIALPPGDYVLKKRLQDHLRMRRFALAKEKEYRVDETAMERVDFADDYAKGLSLEARRARLEQLRGRLRAVLIYQSFLSGEARSALFPPSALFGVGIDVSPVLGARLETELLFGGRNKQTLALRQLELSYDFFEAQLGAALLWGAQLGDFNFEAGPKISGLYLKRQFPSDPILSQHAQDYFTLSPALAGVIGWYPGSDRDFALELAARCGYLPFSVDANRTLFYLEAGLTLGYRL